MIGLGQINFLILVYDKIIQKLINPKPNTEGSKSIKNLLLNDEIKKKR